MRLELGCDVRCTDAPFGELADVVIDPIARRITHLVVAPHHRPEDARLVPVDRASDDGSGIALDYSVAELEGLERVRETAYLRLGEFPVEDPEWEIGVEDVLALPLYRDLDGFGVAMDPEQRVMVNYDRIPKHTVEIRRASAVRSSDGHHLGHVDGFLVSAGGSADIVLERGHLWGRREIVIPAGSVQSIEDDAVILTLTKDEVGALDARRVHRWF